MTKYATCFHAKLETQEEQEWSCHGKISEKVKEPALQGHLVVESCQSIFQDYTGYS